MDGLEQLFDRLMAWLNANEGVVEGFAVLIAVMTLAFPQLRAALFGNSDNKNGNVMDVSALDPALIDSMLAGAARGGSAGSFFAPRLPAFGRLDQTWSSGTTNAAAEDAGGSPTIAVFPFSALDEDEKRAGLCHALSDEIATGFSGMIGYDVLAGRAVHGLEHQIAHTGARYLVEGSIRTLGETVRIIARVVDVATGRHLWAERFDCPRDDINAREEDLVQRITWEVIDHIQAAEVARAAKADPQNLDSWSLAVLAFSGVGAAQQKEGALEAERLARLAVEQDPESALANAVLAATLMQKRGFNLKSRDQVTEQEIRAAGEKALSIAPDDAMVNVIYGFVLTSLNDAETAIPHLRRAVEINPVNARAHAHLGRALRNAGKFDEALSHVQHSLRIAPRDPMAFIWWSWIATALLLQGDATGAIAAEKRSIALSRRYYWSWLVLAAAYGLDGQVDEAKKAAKEAMNLNEDLQTPGQVEQVLRGSIGDGIDISPLLKGLHEAGLR